MDDLLAFRVPLGGFAIGVAFGAVVDRTGFCTMGAISDWIVLGDTARLRGWFMAIAVAMLGTQLLHLIGAIDLSRAIYTGSRLTWLGHVAGGCAFGIGMTLAGGCGSRALARLGAGNLKSLIVVLVLGITAYATLRGVLAPLRLALIDVTSLALPRGQALPDLLAPDSVALRAALAAIFALGIATWACRGDARLIRSRPMVAGIIVGVLVVAGWAVTGILGHDEFTPAALASLTFVAPIGDTIIYAMLFTGTPLGFGAATCLGVIAGAGASAVQASSFKIEVFIDRGDFLRHLAGASLMGIGGVLALGCSIGQGITGVATLALGSLLTLVSIIGGGAIATHFLSEGSWRAAFAALIRGDR